MNKDSIITIINNRCIEKQYEVNLLFAFQIEDRKYLVLSKNEKDIDGNQIVYPVRMYEKEDKQFITNLDNKEYEMIRLLLKDMIKYGGNKYE